MAGAHVGAASCTGRRPHCGAATADHFAGSPIGDAAIGDAAIAEIADILWPRHRGGGCRRRIVQDGANLSLRSGLPHSGHSAASRQGVDRVMVLSIDERHFGDDAREQFAGAVRGLALICRRRCRLADDAFWALSILPRSTSRPRLRNHQSPPVGVFSRACRRGTSPSPCPGAAPDMRHRCRPNPRSTSDIPAVGVERGRHRHAVGA